MLANRTPQMIHHCCDLQMIVDGHPRLAFVMNGVFNPGAELTDGVDVALSSEVRGCFAAMIRLDDVHHCNKDEFKTIFALLKTSDVMIQLQDVGEVMMPS